MNVETLVERLQFVSLFILIIQSMYNNITLFYRDEYTFLKKCLHRNSLQH